MDWHFQVHQRSTEAEKRGTHRSWYVDQQVSLLCPKLLVALRKPWPNLRYRTGSKPEKLSTRSTTCLPKKRLPKPPKMQRDQSTSSCQIQVAALTLFAQSVRNDLRTSGSTRSKNGYGSIQCWWATGPITPRAVPRRRETENLHPAIHGELQSRFWERGKQRRAFCLQRLECRSRLCSDMSMLLIKRKTERYLGGNLAILRWSKILMDDSYG